MKSLQKQITLFILIVFICSCGNDAKQKVEAIRADSIAKTNDSIPIKNGNLTYLEAYNKALMLWQLPLEEKEIKTSFGNAHVIICGPENGEAMILLHGMNASSTMWYPNVKSLSKQYRIYAIDFLLEPGKSMCDGEMNNTDQIVNWYYEIFDQLHLKKFNLLGASRGGWLALNIALRSPDRIDKMALLSPAQAFKWIKMTSDVLSNLSYSMFPKRKRLRDILSTMTSDVDNLDQTFIDQYYVATKEATTSKCILQMTPFSDDQLRSLTMPVLVLIGDQDIINSEKSLERAKKLFPNVETGEIRNAGHFLSIDQPVIVDKIVLDFFNNSKKVSAKK